MIGQLIDCPACKRTIEVGTSQPIPPSAPPPRQRTAPHNNSAPRMIKQPPQSPANKSKAILSIFGISAACILMAAVAMFVINATGSSKSTLNKMLKCVKKGEDPGTFWIGDTAKQKLYNVIDYEILSSRPLNEVIRPFIGVLNNYAETGIIESEKTIKEINEKVSDYKNKFPNYNRLGSISMPSNDDIIHNFESLKNAVTAASPYLSQQERADLMALTQKVVTLTEDEDITAYGAIIDLYIASGNILIGNSRAKEYIDDAPGLLLVEGNKLNKFNHIIDSLKSLPEGIAYKVKINSTNKAGQPIIWMWTITVINTDGGWKISYMYDEEELTENTDLDELSSAIISITGH